MLVETIFFDAGNTLCYVNMNIISEVLDDLGCPVSPATLRDAEPRARRKIDDAEYFARTNDATRFTDYFRLTLHEAGVRDESILPVAMRRLRAYHETHNLWNDLPPDIPPLLDRLRRSGYRLAVVSNSNGSVRRKMEEFGLLPLFDAVIDSHVEGVEKPDPRIFQVALERTNSKRESTLHVGDLYQADALGALAVGITPVLLDPAGLHADKSIHRIRALPELETLLRNGLTPRNASSIM